MGKRIKLHPAVPYIAIPQAGPKGFLLLHHQIEEANPPPSTTHRGWKKAQNPHRHNPLAWWQTQRRTAHLGSPFSAQRQIHEKWRSLSLRTRQRWCSKRLGVGLNCYTDSSPTEACLVWTEPGFWLPSFLLTMSSPVFITLCPGTSKPMLKRLF